MEIVYFLYNSVHKYHNDRHVNVLVINTGGRCVNNFRCYSLGTSSLKD